MCYLEVLFFSQFHTLFIVPVVNDGLPARIRACEARPRLANCGGVRRGSERSDRPSRMQPEPPNRRRSVYSPVKRSKVHYDKLLKIYNLLFINNFYKLFILYIQFHYFPFIKFFNSYYIYFYFLGRTSYTKTQISISRTSRC